MAEHFCIKLEFLLVIAASGDVQDVVNLFALPECESCAFVHFPHVAQACLQEKVSSYQRCCVLCVGFVCLFAWFFFCLFDRSSCTAGASRKGGKRKNNCNTNFTKTYQVAHTVMDNTSHIWRY